MNKSFGEKKRKYLRKNKCKKLMDIVMFTTQTVNINIQYVM
jgi:hypothetical protein